MHLRALRPVVAVATLLLALAACSSAMPLAAPTPSDTAPPYAAPAQAPLKAANPVGVGVASLVDELWLADTAHSTGIPERALSAYAGVAIAKTASMPTCGLSWNTLAAIGYVESRDGSYGGATIGADGTVSPPIYGVALDGGSTASIPDSDQGKIDGDPDHDRAVGPMQLIPQTWRHWHTDASGDGVEDPQNIEDAVMATANYLCRASKDMVDPAGWRRGIAAYNSAPSYLRLVAKIANSYSESDVK